MSSFKKPFGHPIFSIVVCLILISSFIIFGSETTIVQAATTPTPTQQATPTATSSTSGPFSVLPFNLMDISLFFAVLSIILVPTSKLVPRYYQMVPSVVRKLEVAALVVSLLFLLTAAWQVISAIIGQREHNPKNAQSVNHHLFSQKMIAIEKG